MHRQLVRHQLKHQRKVETSGSASVVEAADPNKRVLAMPSVRQFAREKM